MSGINRWALYSSTFPQIFNLFLKDPGPLKGPKHDQVEGEFFYIKQTRMVR